MQTRTKALIGGLALIVLAAAATVVLRAQEQPAALAELEVARQSVKVERASGGVAETAQASDLAVGDRVTTDAQGLGTVNWFDGSLTRLGGDADFVVKELSSVGGGRRIAGQLNFGQSWHRVKEATGSASRFEVRTSDAIASVRGTTFLVRCIPNCRYGVAEGRVQVVTDGGENTTLDGGEQVDVDENGKLGQVEPLDLEDPWLKMNQELDSELPDLEDADETPGRDQGADGGGGSDADASTTTTTRPPFDAPPTTSPPSTAASGGARSAPQPTSDDGPPPQQSATTPTGTIPADPPPSSPPPPVPGSPEPGPSTPGPPAAAPAKPKTSEPDPTTSSSTTSSSTTSSSTTSSSTTSSSTTSSSTTSTSTTSTTSPPTTEVSTTSPPPSGGGGGGSAPTTSSTSPPTTAPPATTPPTTEAPTPTTEPPEETGSISGTVFEPDGSTFGSEEKTTDTTVELKADTTATTAELSSFEVSEAMAVACPHGVEDESVVCFADAVGTGGTYTIPDLPSGKYDVFATPPSTRDDIGVSEIVVVELAAGEDKAGIDLTYVEFEEFFELTGTVYDASEQPVDGATVEARTEGCVCGSATTDAKGNYSMWLPAGEYEVSAVKDEVGSDSATVGIVDGPVVHNFFLTPPTPVVGSIAGTVRTTDGTVSGVTVHACPAPDESDVDAVGPCVTTTSLEDGTYAFAGLSFDTWTVYADPPLESGLESSAETRTLDSTAPDHADVDILLRPEEIFCARECVIASWNSAERLHLAAAREPPAPP